MEFYAIDVFGCAAIVGAVAGIIRLGLLYSLFGVSMLALRLCRSVFLVPCSQAKNIMPLHRAQALPSLGYFSLFQRSPIRPTCWTTGARKKHQKHIDLLICEVKKYKNNIDLFEFRGLNIDDFRSNSAQIRRWRSGLSSPRSPISLACAPITDQTHANIKRNIPTL